MCPTFFPSLVLTIALSQYPWPKAITGIERIALAAQGDLQRVLRYTIPPFPLSPLTIPQQRILRPPNRRSPSLLPDIPPVPVPLPLLTWNNLSTHPLSHRFCFPHLSHNPNSSSPPPMRRENRLHRNFHRAHYLPRNRPFILAGEIRHRPDVQEDGEGSRLWVGRCRVG